MQQLLIDNLGYIQLNESTYKNNLNEGISTILKKPEFKTTQYGSILVPTLLSTADEKNGNGRIYPYSILKEAVDKLMSKQKSNDIYGSLDHYDDVEVKFETSSHKMVDFWWKGNKLYGTIEIFDYEEVPKGRLVAKLLKTGNRVGISSRSLGNVTQRGDILMVESLDIITYDLVTINSNKDSVLNNLNESVSFDKDLYIPNKEVINNTKYNKLHKLFVDFGI